MLPMSKLPETPRRTSTVLCEDLYRNCSSALGPSGNGQIRLVHPAKGVLLSLLRIGERIEITLHYRDLGKDYKYTLTRGQITRLYKRHSC